VLVNDETALRSLEGRVTTAPDDLRQLLERVLGWADSRPVDRAIRLMERFALHGTPLVLCGDRDSDLVRIAHAIHRRAFGVESLFVLADPRRSPRNAGLVSRPTVTAALELAAGGVLCVRSRRPPHDFGRVVHQLRDAGARLVVCADAAERSDVLLFVADPIRVPTLASRRHELSKIVDGYADDARADLGLAAPFMTSHRLWVMRHCASLPEIALATRRLVALQCAGNVAGAAALLVMGHTSLGEWLHRRRGWRDQNGAARSSPSAPRPSWTRGRG